MVLAVSDRLPLIPSYSGYLQKSLTFRVRDDRPLWCHVPVTSAILMIGNFLTIARPKALQPLMVNHKVWAVPVSLATTRGITIVFSSSAYLDVSVQRVSFMHLCIHCMIYRHYSIWVVPFGDPGVNDCFRLTQAYRR